jgi:CubicO group peptidase (beta-lactamase class C family)
LKSVSPTLLAIFALAASASAAEPRDISAELEAMRAEYKLPACASAVIEAGRIVAIGAAGVRRLGSDVRVTTSDVWHIGSCTKSMTALLAGILVDAGKLRWDTSIPDALPAMPCDPGWRNVTIEHLVTHRSGIAPMSPGEWRTLDAGNGSPREQRATFARGLLSKPPANPPGKFVYSNSAYGLLGAIIERAANDSYENLLRLKIFVPLGLATAGFGAPATPGKIDQPWGHYRRDGRLVPAEPLPGNQFPPALAPAASVHMSLTDFAHYAEWLSSGKPRIVTRETFTHLQTPPDGSTYAGGLWKTELPGVGGDALCHTGHMGGLFGVFHAGRERACVTVFNTAGDGWEWLGDEIAAVALKAAK